MIDHLLKRYETENGHVHAIPEPIASKLYESLQQKINLLEIELQEQMKYNEELRKQLSEKQEELNYLRKPRTIIIDQQSGKVINE